MQRKKRWTENDLREATKTVSSMRALIKALHLIPAGGNYRQIQKYLKVCKIDTSHFKGSAWNKGQKGKRYPRTSLKLILQRGTHYQSYKLKRRLFDEGIKEPACELCGWAKISADGRLPLELDHINGQSNDNRLVNLRVLCPNCHSLQVTHRGRSRKRAI